MNAMLQMMILVPLESLFSLPTGAFRIHEKLHCDNKTKHEGAVDCNTLDKCEAENMVGMERDQSPCVESQDWVAFM